MIETKRLTKSYINKKSGVVTEVLKGIDIQIKRGEFVAIMGKSGAGKSTLMYQLSALDVPTGGDVVIEKKSIVKMSEKERTQMRLNQFGYIFQDYALMPEFTAVENVMIPLISLGMSFADARTRSRKALDAVELGHRYSNRPNQLSGGEQQRVSIARAAAQEPEILFADEPTANLDSLSSLSVLQVLRELHQAGQTIVMVTHEPEYTRGCDRIIFMEDGVITREMGPKEIKKFVGDR